MSRPYGNRLVLATSLLAGQVFLLWPRATGAALANIRGILAPKERNMIAPMTSIATPALSGLLAVRSCPGIFQRSTLSVQGLGVLMFWHCPRIRTGQRAQDPLPGLPPCGQIVMTLPRLTDKVWFPLAVAHHSQPDRPQQRAVGRRSPAERLGRGEGSHS